MDSQIIAALITATATIATAIITGWFALKVKEKEVNKERELGHPSSQSKNRVSYWLWGIVGATIGAVAMLTFLGFIGILPQWPISHPTPTTPSPKIGLYDNFDKPEIDTNLWTLKLSPQCDVKQENGQMVFKNVSSQEKIDCRLYVKRLVTSVNDLQLFEAQVKIDEGYKGEYLIQGIEFATTTSGGGYWSAFCGLTASSNNLNFGTHVWAEQGTEVQRWFTATPNQWYTVRLELDPKTLETRCFVDDQLVGSVISKYSPEFKDLAFERFLSMHRGNGAVATSYVDNVRILP